jgi:NIMA (never in mitosis gene a)-related kinase 1/4/5
VYEEPLQDRAFAKFLQDLPGISASDSQSYRIEALRVYLEDNLGEKAFVAAYKHYSHYSENDEKNVSEVNEDIETEIESILGKKKMKFYPLIYHLIVCEDSYYNKNLVKPS